jgi:hypothetical protein
VKSTNGGASWNSNSPTEVESYQYGSDLPSLYVNQDPNSNGSYDIYAGVTILDASVNPNVVNIYKSTDAGHTFSSPIYSAYPDDPAQGSTITVGKDGTVYVAYAKLDETKAGYPTEGIFIDACPVGGQFSNLTSYTAHQIGAKGTGSSYFYLKLFIRVTCVPSMDIDRNTGTLYVVWPDTNSLGEPDIDVAVGVGSGNSYTFTTTPQNLTNTSSAYEFAPAVSVHPDGVVSILYYKCFPDQPNENDNMEVHLGRYTLGVNNQLTGVDTPINIQPDFLEKSAWRPPFLRGLFWCREFFWRTLRGMG